MSNRLVAVALVFALVSASACTASRALMVTGAVTTGLGAIAMVGGSGHRSSGCGGGSFCSGYDSVVYEPVADVGDDLQMGLGGGIVLAGLVMVAAGMLLHDNDDEPLPATNPLRPVAGPSVVVVTESSASVASPAEMALRSRLENRLAIQASFSARRGDCFAAVATSVELAKVDPAMHAELVHADADLANCLARAAQN